MKFIPLGSRIHFAAPRNHCHQSAADPKPRFLQAKSGIYKPPVYKKILNIEKRDALHKRALRFCAIFAAENNSQNIYIMKKIGIMAICAAVVLSSCQSQDQFSAGVGGGMLGGIFGSAIGGLMGGPRGADAGTAIGVLAGVAAGVAATTPQVRGQGDYDYTSDTYNRHRKTVYSSSQQEAEQMGREYANLEIKNLRFIDPNHNQSIDANETSKIVFEVKNNGAGTIYNIAPVLTVSGSKHIVISPTAVISYIAAGQSVRYSAEIYANRRLKDGMADFTISFVKGNYQYTMSTFQLATKARRK